MSSQGSVLATPSGFESSESWIQSQQLLCVNVCVDVSMCNLYVSTPVPPQIQERHPAAGSNSTSCVFMVNRPYALVCSAVAFYVPLGLMVLAYQRIYVTAMGHARQIGTLQRAGSAPKHYPSPAGAGEQPSSSRMRVETKAAKTLAVIMGCFCLCWAPFFVTNVVDPFVRYSVPWQVWTAWLWLGYINSGLNPFLYAFLNRAFRRAFLLILCCGDERYARQGSYRPTRPCHHSVNGTSLR